MIYFDKAVVLLEKYHAIQQHKKNIPGSKGQIVPDADSSRL